MLPLLVCVAGIFLGLYFNVLVLLPLSLIGSAIFISVNLSWGLSFYADIGDLLVSLISGQAGWGCAAEIPMDPCWRAFTQSNPTEFSPCFPKRPVSAAAS